jgi:hypothetical protein
MINNKVEINKADMVDFSNRMSTAVQIGNSIGLNRDDMSLLLFILMGDAKEGNLNDILKKVKLPRVAHGLILIRGYRTGHMRKYIQNGMSTDQH